MRSRVRSALSLLAVVPALCGCGAGVIVGIAAGSGDRSSPPPVQSPTIILGENRAPLALALPTLRALVVNNYQAADPNLISVTLEAAGVSQEQPIQLAFPEVSSNSTRLTFFVKVQEQDATGIFFSVPDPTAEDIPATLSVRLAGQLIAPPASFTLNKQRKTTLEPQIPGETVTKVSVLGNTLVRVRVTGREDESQLVNPLFVVANSSQLDRDPDVQRVPGSMDFLVTGRVPPSRFPINSQAFVIDDVAGVSSGGARIAYHPEILAVSPAVGSTEGDALVVLFGEGMAPQLDPDDPLSLPDLSRVRIEFGKGGRILTVEPSELRVGSSYTQLSFPIPQSPDGQPGPADIELRIDLGSIEVTDEVEDGFVYRRPNPSFGPRGALLTEMSTRVRFVDVVGATDADPDGVPDATVVSSLGGIPRVELLIAQQNGMFSSFGPTFAAGEQSDPGQRQPTDVCVGDFDADQDPDLLVLNRGAANVATHTWLRGESAPDPPFELSEATLPGQPGGTFSATGDLDADGVPDVVLLPMGTANVEPQVALARPGAASPFAITSLAALSAHKPFDAATVADADGDGALDLLCLTGGVAMRLVIAYGDGTGGFASPLTVIPIALPGYTPDTASRAIGVHAVDAGAGQRPIALVLSGVDASAATPPTIAALTPAGARAYAMPAEVVTYPTARAFVASAFGDLDGVAPGELVVGAPSDMPPSPPELRLLRFASGSFAEIPQGFAPSLESMGAIHSVSIVTAVPTEAGRAPTRAVIVHHRLNDSSEERLSTWLAASTPTLHMIAPDASLELASGVQGAALGDFVAQTTSAVDRDLCLANALGVDVFVNDGVGNFTLHASHPLSGVVQGTLATIAIGGRRGEAVAVLRADGTLGTLHPDDAGPVLSAFDLRSRATAAARGWTVSPLSRLCAADIDGDAAQDLVVMLVLDDPATTAYETDLLLLRGKSAPMAAELPWEMPSPGAPIERVAERATSVVAGDFARSGSTPEPIEVAVAFPDESNHVRFFRYAAGATPSADGLVRSFQATGVDALIAGDQPAQLFAADFDDNKTTDLAVASAGDSGVRVFSQPAEIAASPEVNISAFTEGLTVPALPVGFPIAMFGADLDGDEIGDLVVVTTDTTGGQKNHSFAVYGSSGNGGLRSLGMPSQTRTGNKRPNNTLRDGDVFPALADVNGDGVPDLVIGWSTASMNDHNLRVMFGAAR